MNIYHVKLATLGLSLVGILTLLVINSQDNHTLTGGSISLVMPGVEIKRTSDGIDFEKLLSEESSFHKNKESAKRVFGLYEIDSDLISAIEKLAYDSPFSIELRKMHERMRGPFFAPDVTVELAFSDQIGVSRAQVCADSMFLNKSLTIATEDGGSMDMIENANELLLHECPAHQREFEKIIVAEKFGARLLGTENPPPSVQVIAKAIPSIRFINLPDQEP